MKFIELKKNLKANVFPAYLITGKDSFLKKKAEELIENAVIEKNAELNSIIFSTDKLDPEKVVEACNTLPFFANKKLVIVKEYSKKKADNLISKLENYLKNPNESTCLVLISDTGSNYFDKLKGCLEVIDCASLSANMLTTWIVNKLKEFDKQIEKVAAMLLIDYCNYDLARINMELLKLISYIQNDKIITANHIKDNVNKDLEFQVYELTNALSHKNAKEAFTILNNLLANKSTVSAVLASIYRHFRRLFHISVSDLNNAELASKLEVKEYAVLKARELAKKFSPVKLKKINEMCVDVDYKSKTGKLDAVKGINFLILSILNM